MSATARGASGAGKTTLVTVGDRGPSGIECLGIASCTQLSLYFIWSECRCTFLEHTARNLKDSHRAAVRGQVPDDEAVLQIARVQHVRDIRTMRCASLFILPAAESGESGGSCGCVGVRMPTWTVREWSCRTTTRDAVWSAVLLALLLYCFLGRI